MLLSEVVGFSIVSALGIPLTDIALMLVFVVVGIGVDDIIIVVINATLILLCNNLSMIRANICAIPLISRRWIVSTVHHRLTRCPSANG